MHKYIENFTLGNGATWDKLLHVVLIIIIIFLFVRYDSEKTKKVITTEDTKLQEVYQHNKTKNEALRENLQKNPQAEIPNNKNVFTGTIESVDSSCFTGEVCSVMVSGKKVVTTIGTQRSLVKEVGTMNLINTTEFGKHIGEKAEVYGLPTDDGFTLYGSTEYYLNLVK
jgi:uncharacterized protein (UPF0333 family)